MIYSARRRWLRKNTIATSIEVIYKPSVYTSPTKFS